MWSLVCRIYKWAYQSIWLNCCCIQWLDLLENLIPYGFGSIWTKISWQIQSYLLLIFMIIQIICKRDSHIDLFILLGICELPGSDSFFIQPIEHTWQYLQLFIELIEFNTCLYRPASDRSVLGDPTISTKKWESENIVLLVSKQIGRWMAWR